MKYFIVNQNRTQKEEISGGYLWAPKDKKGRKQQHWDTLLKIEKETSFSVIKVGIYHTMA